MTEQEYYKLYNKLNKILPKENRKDLQKLITQAFTYGSAEMQNLIRGIEAIKPEKVSEYCIVHEDELDGG